MISPKIHLKRYENDFLKKQPTNKPQKKNPAKKPNTKTKKMSLLFPPPAKGVIYTSRHFDLLRVLPSRPEILEAPLFLAGVQGESTTQKCSWSQIRPLLKSRRYRNIYEADTQVWLTMY